jgi:hypothetical protein
MKKFILFFSLLISSLSFAQTEGFNYKALLTDNGNALSNLPVSFRFTILQDGMTIVYQETHTTNTDANGIVSVTIGEGTSADDFNTIDWGSHQYSLKVEINTGTGFTDFGTNPLKKVPFAKYADKAANVFSGNFNDLTNVPAGLADGDDDTHLTDAQIAAMGYIKNPNDADHDPTNELQTISKSSNTVTLSNGGGSFIDADTHLTDTDIAAMGYIKDPNDADHDASNELQNLTLSGNQLSISDGNSVTFANWDTNASDDVQALNDLSDARSTTNGVFIGPVTGANASNNMNLVGLGKFVLSNATNADYSVGIGNLALNSLTNGSYNTAIGYGAGQFLNSGENNTFVGYLAGLFASGNGNVFIGNETGKNETGNNKLYIDNSDTDTPLIYGDFSTNELTINGSLAIKDGTEGAGKVLVSDANGKASWSNNLPKQSKIMSISQFDAVSAHQTTELFQGYYGATILDNNSSDYLYFPIRLPEGAIIQSIQVFYWDNSSYDFYLGISSYSLSSYTDTNLGNYTTSGSTNYVRNHTFTINLSINSDNIYYVFVMPKSGDYWDSNLAIRGIKVYYTE